MENIELMWLILYNQCSSCFYQQLLINNNLTLSFSSQCFYIPKCQMDKDDLRNEVQEVRKRLEHHMGRNYSCLSDHKNHPNHVIWHKKYTLRRVLYGLLWPCLMLGGGALLVGFVKMTQCLAHMSSEVRIETVRGRLTSRCTQGKLYKLVRRSSTQSPTWDTLYLQL